jgi:hypothetical protein
MRMIIEPRVNIIINNADPPIRRTPLVIVRRSESNANERGSHESIAIFAITRGPSMKPV